MSVVPVNEMEDDGVIVVSVSGKSPRLKSKPYVGDKKKSTGPNPHGTIGPQKKSSVVVGISKLQKKALALTRNTKPVEVPSPNSPSSNDASNPRGDLETICRRDSRFGWPEFDTAAEGPTHHQAWLAVAKVDVQVDPTNKVAIRAEGRHIKKTKAISIGRVSDDCG
jgi:hypothetical protein